MARELKTIKVAPGSELAKLLEEAEGGDLLLEKDGEIYHLNREKREDLFAGYDPMKVREALARTAGSWADLDTDAVIAEIYRAREEGSRPPDRP